MNGEPSDKDSASVRTCRRGFFARLMSGLGAGFVFNAALRGSLAMAAPSRVYVVRAGDTLSEIAEEHDITLERLRSLNGIESDIIRPGQKLRLGGEKEFPLLKPVRSQIVSADLTRRRWSHIVLHHSATSTGNAKIFDRYHREQRHMENGLAYHFIIGNGSDSADGEIEVGNRWTQQLQGGHVRSFSYNENSVGICLVGDFERAKPSSRQIAACLELVEYVKRTLLGGRPNVLLHREIKGEHTLCPGRHFPASRFSNLRA